MDRASEGAAIRFEVDGHADQTLEVFTTRPDTLFGATFLVVAPEHPLVQRTDNPKVKAYCEAAANRSERERQADDQDKTGGLGSARYSPGQRRVGAHLGRRLRSDGLRDRRDHGRAWS